MLTFLSIAWMSAKMMQVEVCGLRFVKTVNGEPWMENQPQQPVTRCTQCRSAVAKWDTSIDSGWGGGGAVAVGGVWMGCSGVRMGCRQSGERKDVKGGEGIMGYEIF